MKSKTILLVVHLPGIPAWLRTCLLASLCLSTGPPDKSVLAQNIPLGTWRTHASYQSLTTLAIAGERVYGGASGSLFFYDLSFNNATKLSTLDGLSGVDVSRVAYLAPLRTLVIAYQSGNVDLLQISEKPGQPDRITQVDAIQRSAIPGSKYIRDITLRGNLAYLSGDFGLVVLDVAKAEVRETYRNIGFNGVPVSVYACTFTPDSLFLASSQGVLAASLADNVNRQDFANWRTFTAAQGISTTNVRAIASGNGRVYAGVSRSGVFAYQNGRWASIAPSTDTIRTIRASNDQLLVSTGPRLLSISSTNAIATLDDGTFVAPQEAAFDAQGKLWVADAQAGLLSNRSGRFEPFNPNGPASNQVVTLYEYGQKMVALPGGYNDQVQPLNRQENFSVFNGSQWTNSRLSVPDAKDLVAAAYQPTQQRLYLGSFGSGLLAQRLDGTIEQVTGTPLVRMGNTVRVTGLATDAADNLWVANYGVPAGSPSLHVLRVNNQWESFAFTQTGANNPLGMLIDANGYIWLRLDPTNRVGGLLVFDPQGRRSRYLGTATGNGELPNFNVRSMVLDKDGQVWVGTDNGVAVFFNTVNAFANPYAAFAPVFNNRRLLNEESITALAVDGGNRKWIGTRNGLWLFSADGSELIANFTTQNSPLFSNTIRDIRVEPVTGEVFVATDKGLLSYRGTATEADTEPTQVQAFPNPVRPDFEGLVGISGLAANVTVKITDTAGRLVYQTRANGGTATWNVRDYHGNRAENGVYLVFTASDDGTATLVTKLAVVK